MSQVDAGCRAIEIHNSLDVTVREAGPIDAETIIDMWRGRIFLLGASSMEAER